MTSLAAQSSLEICPEYLDMDMPLCIHLCLSVCGSVCIMENGLELFVFVCMVPAMSLWNGLHTAGHLSIQPPGFACQGPAAVGGWQKVGK